jgi:hypothetical protein
MKNKLRIFKKCLTVLIVFFVYGTFNNLIVLAAADNSEIKIYYNGERLPSLKTEKENSKIVVEIDTQKKDAKILEENVDQISNTKISAKSTNSINLNGVILPATLVSAFISAAVTFIIYFLNRSQAKRQIKFDLALKNLLPDVYIPLLHQLSKNKIEGKNIDTFKIKQIIDENVVMLEFVPKKQKEIIDKIYADINKIKGNKSFQEQEGNIVKLLTDLESEIFKRFGALKG